MSVLDILIDEGTALQLPDECVYIPRLAELIYVDPEAEAVFGKEEQLLGHLYGVYRHVLARAVFRGCLQLPLAEQLTKDDLAALLLWNRLTGADPQKRCEDALYVRCRQAREEELLLRDEAFLDLITERKTVSPVLAAELLKKELKRF